MGHVNIHSFLNLKLKKMLTFSFENSTKISSVFFSFITSFSVSKLLYHLKRRYVYKRPQHLYSKRCKIW